MAAASVQPIRYREDGFEYRCPTCREWWPLNLEHWKPKTGMVRCRACIRLNATLDARSRRQDELARLAQAERRRVNYAANRIERRAARAAWRARHPRCLKAYRRRYYDANREKAKAASRAYYGEAREVILFKKRSGRGVVRGLGPSLDPRGAGEPLTESQLFAGYGVRSA